MICIKLNGRLGNQMFQYAFAYASARLLGTSFFYRSCYESRLTEYFELRLCERLLNRLFTLIYKCTEKYEPFRFYEQQSHDNPRDFSLKNHTCYSGFFQSANYFAQSSIELQKIFSVKTKYVSKFHELYGKSFDDNLTVAVHVRRTDYVKYGGFAQGGPDLRLPLSYYIRAIKQIEDRDNYVFYFIGDDVDFVRKSFEHRRNYHFISNDEIIDFQVILNADICILANSSFSWWAAYLNKKKSKKVYAPKYWSGFKVLCEYPNGIVPCNWEQIDSI